MGEEVYSEYVASIDDSKWAVLKSKLVDSVNKISPIANYVYYFHRKEHKFASGDTGDYMTKKDNTLTVQPEHKMIAAWNNMVELNYEVCKWIFYDVIMTETPEIVTTAAWDYSMWESDLLKKQTGYL